MWMRWSWYPVSSVYHVYVINWEGLSVLGMSCFALFCDVLCVGVVLQHLVLWSRLCWAGLGHEICYNECGSCEFVVAQWCVLT
jgi:hypothetical protein